MPHTAESRERRKIPLPQSDGPLSTALRGGKWLVTSAGLAGIFTVLGFLVDAANQDLLGYRIPGAGSIARYPLLAGQFMVDSLTFFFSWIGSHLPIATAVLLTILGVKYFFTKLDLTKKRTISIRALARMMPSSLQERLDVAFELKQVLPHPKTRSFLVGTGLLAVLVMLDFPTLAVKDMLVTTVDAGANIRTSTFVGNSSYDLWRDHVCSRIRGRTQSAVLAERGVQCRSPAAHTLHLRGFYLLNFFLTVVGLTTLLGLVRKQLAYKEIGLPANRVIEYVWPLLAPLIMVVAVLDVAGLPYAYAKTVRSTVVNTAVVDLSIQEVGAEEPSSAPAAPPSAPVTPVAPPAAPAAPVARSAASAVPPTSPVASPGVPAAATGAPTAPPGIQVMGFLLEEGGDELILFNADKDEIWMVQRSSVTILRILQKSDVLQSHILKNLN
jgi:hypothetical protein